MFTSLSTDTYPTFKTWGKKFPDGKVDLTRIIYHRSWAPMFTELFEDKRFEKSTKDLSDLVKKDSDVKICPPPELLFNAFLHTSFDKLKVVILGQDPYFGSGQAMGMSFSVPYGMDIPSSQLMLSNATLTTVPTDSCLSGPRESRA